MADLAKTSGDGELQVPMPDVIRFIRQLSHDLRNQLNAAELQSAYLKEVAEDGEVKEEIQRLRAMLGEMGNSLHQVTALLATVKLTEMPYEAVAWMEDLEQKFASTSPERKDDIVWEVNVGSAVLQIDPQFLQQAVLELLTNAFLHSRGTEPIRVSAAANEAEFSLQLIEPKAGFADATENWGREPFRKVKHGHYGLGLHRVRNIIEAHRGRFEVRHDPETSSLITTIALPLGTGE